MTCAPLLILFNKPYGVLCQFSGGGERATLADHIPLPHVYAAGRLDADSEGLLALTNDGALQARIAHPRHKLAKVYWAQVEGTPPDAALRQLASGVLLEGTLTRPARVRRIAEPADLWARVPPIRVRLAIPTSWLEIELREGRNRQVRRMTAAIGYPTLRLVRWRIGEWSIDGLGPGDWREIRV